MMTATMPPLLFAFEGFAWLLVPLLPALVALYFLKLKRRTVLVSSTLLWKRSIEDMRANAPFQRLRRSLLLLLQLLTLLGLILAASKPILTGWSSGGRSILLLIDRSASMNTRENGGTRLDAARREGMRLVNGMVAGDRLAVVAFAQRAEVLQPLTADAALLGRTIDAIEPTSLPTDLPAALSTVQAMAESLPSAEIFILGDGAYGELAGLPLELRRFGLRYIGIGKAADNLGIVELDVRRGFGSRGRVELFVSVGNFAGDPTAAPRRVGLGVYQGERLLAAAELEIPAGQTRPHTFDVSRLAVEGGETSAVLKVEISDGGALPDDDRGFVRVAPPGRLAVLVVGEANAFLDRALAVLPQVDAARMPLAEYAALLREGNVGAEVGRVVIFDRAALSIPAGQAIPSALAQPALYLGCAPDHPELHEGGKPEVVKSPIIVDWDRSHPVNRFPAYTDLRIVESLGFAPSRVYRSLLDTPQKSIAGAVSIHPPGAPPVRAIIVGFDVLKSNWPLLHSFPVFIGNAIEWLAAETEGGALPRYRTGEVLSLRAPERTAEGIFFRDPVGRDHPVVPELSGRIAFAATSRTGIYELRSGGKAIDAFPVSLLSARESSIAPRGEIRFGSESVAGQPAATLQTRDLWKLFVLAALAILCLEWWAYNRRMHC